MGACSGGLRQGLQGYRTQKAEEGRTRTETQKVRRRTKQLKVELLEAQKYPGQPQRQSRQS